ncbi:MAG: hypothetical protein ACHQ7M_17475 [Chloroflexota bacterium]
MAGLRIRAISFDGDGTLWDFQQVMRHALRCALSELRAAAPGPSAALTIDAMIAMRNQVAEELRGRVTNLEAVRLAAFAHPPAQWLTEAVATLQPQHPWLARLVLE